MLHTAKKPGAGDPASASRCRTTPTACRSRSARFTTKGVYDDERARTCRFMQGAGHGGSHPHLVHEFVSALVEDRDPFPNARRSANWTCVGLCAHESALKGGELRCPSSPARERAVTRLRPEAVAG